MALSRPSATVLGVPRFPDRVVVGTFTLTYGRPRCSTLLGVEPRSVKAHSKGGVALLVSTASGTHGAEVVSEVLRRGSSIDDAGFAVLYRHYQPSLTKYAVRRGASDADGSADLAMFDGYKALANDTLRDRSEPAFRTYLYRAINGHIVNEHRHGGLSTVGLTDDIPLDGDHADEAVDRLWLESLIGNLTDAQRNTIRGRFLMDLDAIEVGRLLDKDPNAIHQLQHRALRRLRKLILTLALAVVAIVGIAAVLELVSPEIKVDTTPIDRPDTPTTTTTAPLEADRVTTPVPSAEAQSQDGSGPDALPEPAQSEDNPTAATTELSETTGQATTSTPPTPTPPSTDTTPSSTTVPTTTTTAAGGQTSRPPDGPILLNPPNLCVSEQLTATLWQHRLYTEIDDPQEAAVFAQPAAVRFVDNTDAVLQVVDTSGPMTTGLTPNTHGWLSPSDPAGTFADFDQAPQPTFWGVLTSADAATWASIQFRIDGSSTWIDILNCG